MSIYISVIFLVFPFLIIFAISLRKENYCIDKKFWQKQKWKLSEIDILFLIIALIQSIGYVFIYYNIYPNQYFYLYLSAFLNVIIFFLLFIYLVIKHAFNFRLFGIDSNRIGSKVLIGFCTFLAYSGFVVGFSILTKKLHLITDRANYFYTINLESIPLLFNIFYIFSLVVITPFFEEFLFRGLIYGPFQKKVGVAWGMLACSFIWTLEHKDLSSFGGIFL